MMPGSSHSQLELFDLSKQPPVKLRPSSLGRFFISFRHDQAVLCGIAALIGVTVVFAGGVERGKQLARAERSLLGRQDIAQAQPVVAAAEKAVAPVEKTAKRNVPTLTPKTTTKKKEPSQLASGGAGRRYVVQAAAYKQIQTAKRELDRLISSGERAFLITRDGYTIVCLGPFPSKTRASEKLASFRSRYQGCFIKSL